jgi:ribonuclease P protein component
VQRLKTRAQFEAAMAGGTVSRTPHFVLHRAPLDAPSASTGPESTGRQALFAVRDEPWIGAVVPKRWAKRAVTRNGIKRQIYNVSAAFASRLPAAAHVVRLRMDFARAEFPSAWSDTLKESVRGELQKLFEQAAQRVNTAQAPKAVIRAKAGTQKP